jgi:hypothetical protein
MFIIDSLLIVGSVILISELNQKVTTYIKNRKY